MNLKAMLICINRLSDAQLAVEAAEAQTRFKQSKLPKDERRYWYIRHLLILNAANERQWQQTHRHLQSAKDSA